MKTSLQVLCYPDLPKDVARALRRLARTARPTLQRPAPPRESSMCSGTWADLRNLVDPFARQERARRRLLKKKSRSPVQSLRRANSNP